MRQKSKFQQAAPRHGVNRVWFDRGSAIASGVSAALVLSAAEHPLNTHSDETVSLMMVPTDAGIANGAIVLSSAPEADPASISHPIRPLPSYSDEWTED